MLTSNLTTSLAARSDRDLPNSDNLKLSSTADVIVTSLTSTSKVVAMPVRNASRGASVNVAAVRPSSLTSDASLYVGTTSSLLEFFFNSKPRPRPNASAMTIAAATAIRRINGCARFVAMARASVARHTSARFRRAPHKCTPAKCMIRRLSFYVYVRLKYPTSHDNLQARATPPTRVG